MPWYYVEATLSHNMAVSADSQAEALDKLIDYIGCQPKTYVTKHKIIQVTEERGRRLNDRRSIY